MSLDGATDSAGDRLLGQRGRLLASIAWADSSFFHPLHIWKPKAVLRGRLVATAHLGPTLCLCSPPPGPMAFHATYTGIHSGGGLAGGEAPPSPPPPLPRHGGVPKSERGLGLSQKSDSCPSTLCSKCPQGLDTVPALSTLLYLVPPRALFWCCFFILLFCLGGVNILHKLSHLGGMAVLQRQGGPLQGKKVWEHFSCILF